MAPGKDLLLGCGRMSMMRRGYADVPEGQIHFLTAGKGEPLLLLHQTPRSSRMYERLLPFLAERYRVIAMDTLGCGNSSPLPPNVRVEDLALSVVHFLDALEVQRCSIFGVHTGATIAGEVAAGWPSRVDRLMLFGCNLIDPGPEREAIMEQLGGGIARLVTHVSDGSHLMRQWAWAYRTFMRMLWDTGKVPVTDLAPADLPADTLDYLNRWMMDMLQLRDSGPALYHAVFTYDAQARLPLIQAKTLLIESTSPFEPDICRRGHRLTKLVPNSTVARIGGTDSNAPDWKPEELAGLITDFLK